MLPADPIDNLIDQINQNANILTCSKCLSEHKYLLEESCGHYICLNCSELIISKGNYNVCAVCENILDQNLHKMYTEYLSNPIKSLSYRYNINVGDMLWYYQGQGHNWLYNKEQSDYIEEQFKKYEKSQGKNSSKIGINTEINGKNVEYIIDLKTLKQYPLNNPSSPRNISCFKLKNIADLKKNKIIGVSGRLL